MRQCQANGGRNKFSQCLVYLWHPCPAATVWDPVLPVLLFRYLEIQRIPWTFFQQSSIFTFILSVSYNLLVDFDVPKTKNLTHFTLQKRKKSHFPYRFQSHFIPLCINPLNISHKLLASVCHIGYASCSTSLSGWYLVCELNFIIITHIFWLRA